MSLQWDCSSSSVFSMQHQTFTWLAAGRDKKADECQRLFRYYCMSLGYPCFFHSSSIPSSCLHTRLSPVLSISHLFLPLFLIYWPERFFNIEQGERLFVDVTVGNKWGEWSFALLSLFPSFFPQFSFVFYLTFPLFLYICLPVCFL